MKEALQAAIDAAPTEKSLGIAESLTKLRTEKFNSKCKDPHDKEQHRHNWTRLKQLNIENILTTAKVDKVTITDGRTTYTVWNTKETIQILLERVSPAYKTKRTKQP